MYTIETIKQKLATNQAWAERAIVVLYERQTADEQRIGGTTDKNGIGFNAFDAQSLSYYAQWISSGKRLTGKYLQNAFRVLPKYANQILSIINQQS